MNMSTTLLKQKGSKITYAISALLIGAVMFGTTATTFANSSYGGYGGRGGDRYDRDRHDRQDRRDHRRKHHSRYSQIRWVYDREDHRWVRIGYNHFTGRWELIDFGGRFYSGNHNRYSSYRYNY